VEVNMGLDYHATTPADQRLEDVSSARYSTHTFVRRGDLTHWSFHDRSGRDLFVLEHEDLGARSATSDGSPDVDVAYCTFCMREHAGGATCMGHYP
jgi:hypothetical protein